ncbi:hypothetical protein E5672_03775 [Alteromonas portus]|uniref:Uncharacterized protein n=1 Tax=Alteromonas portus TaxID=2565549 RepID=A0A4U0ZS52_9ALTE|nr:oligosaccharide flippase family protein [Alteromonas portus]TKB05211.1 hypothetical protein E5672_03775 [Alteromonas portus]
MTANNRILHLFWVFFEKFGLVLLSVFSFLIYAKFLSPEQMGIGILLLAAVEFFAMFVIALVDNSIIRLNKITTQQDGCIFWGLLLVSLIISSLIYLGYLLYFNDNRILLVGFLAVCSLPFQISVRLHIVHMRLKRQFKKLAQRTIFGKILGMLAGIYLAVGGYGDFSIVVQTLVMAISSALMIFVLEPRRLPFDFDKKFIYEQLLVGVPSSIKAINVTLFMKGLVVLIETTLGTAAVGFYNFASRLVELPRTALTSALMGYANPVFSKRRNEGKSINTLFIDSTRFSILLIMPFFVGMSVMSESIIELLFSDKWAPSSLLLQGIAAVTSLNLFFLFLPSTLVALGKTKLGLKGQIFSSAIGLLFTALTVYEYGLIAIIFGLIVRTISSNIVNFYVLKKVLDITFFEFIKCFTTPITGAISIVVSIAISREILVVHSLLLETTIEVIIGMLAYLLSVFLMNKKVVKEFKIFLNS